MSDTLNLVMESAIRVGAPIVKKIVGDSVGGVISGVAESLVDEVAKQLGVPADKIADADQSQLDKAVARVEDGAINIVESYGKRQRMTNELLKFEIGKSESVWTWAWRPAWMWFLMVVWGSVFVLFPLVNALFRSSIPIPDLSVLSALTIAYLGLYMGGNTVKSFVRKDG